MNVVNIKLCEITSRVVPIGFEGENNRTQVAFDCSAIFEEYPDAVAAMTVKPPVGDIYPVAVRRDGDSVIWDITASDCANDGTGEYQITFTDGDTIIKTWTGGLRVYASLLAGGNPPAPVEEWIEQAQAVLGSLENISASATDLPHGEPATAEITDVGGHKNIAIGIPAGAPGTAGKDGKDGEDGVSPTIDVSAISGGHRVTITDAEGTESFDVLDGEDGAPGAQGEPGFSPTATVTKSGHTATISITDQQGTTTATVSDGDPSDLIDDTTPAANKTFSSVKLTEMDSALKSAIERKFGIQNVGRGLNVSEDVSTGSSRITLNADVQRSDITNLQQNKADIIITNASGSIAAITDGADDLPVESMTVQIEPVQDLHGQSSPYPAGGGKNKFDKTAITDYYYFDEDGNPVSNSSWSVSDYISLSGTVTISGYGDSGSAPRSCWYDENKAFISSFQLPGNSFTVAVPNGAVYARFSVRHNNLNTVQVELGSSATSYAPFSNICPISGWTGCKVTRTGINIWDEETESGYYSVNTGNKIANASQIRSKNRIPTRPNTTYYCKSAKGIWALFWDNNGTLITGYSAASGATSGNASLINNRAFTTPPNGYYMAFYFVVDYGTTYNHDVSFNYPGTDTNYHAYQGSTYPITFDSAGTVYGGTLNPVTGELVVDRAIVDLGTLTWNASTRETTYKIFTTNGIAQLIKDTANNWTIPANFMCSQYKTATFNEAYAGNTNGVISYAKGNHSINLVDSNFADYSVTEVAAALSGVQVVYELATPITYSLTPTEIRTLLGYNAIWADTGDVSVDYRADTKLYIDNKITQAIAAALNA